MQQHQQPQQPQQQYAQQFPQQQQQQHGAQAAPPFAALGASAGLAFSGQLGTLPHAQYPVMQPQQAHAGAQGLSAAIPPGAYLMPQAHLLQQQQQLHFQQQLLQQQAPQQEGGGRAKREDANFGLILPLQKVKRLIKSESNVKAVSAEASYAIARAAELVMESLLEKAHARITEGGRSSIEYDDIAAIVAKWPSTEFARDAVPEIQTLAELIERVRRQDAAAARRPVVAAAPQAAPQAAAAAPAAQPAAAQQADPQQAAPQQDAAQPAAAQPADPQPGPEQAPGEEQPQQAA